MNNENITLEIILNSPKRQRLSNISKLIWNKLLDVFPVSEDLQKDDVSFFEMGLESITATEFSNEMHSVIGDRCQINATTIINYPTVAVLSQYIEKSLFK